MDDSDEPATAQRANTGPPDGARGRPDLSDLQAWLPDQDGCTEPVTVTALTIPQLLNAVPLLTAEEEVTLARTAEAGALAEQRLDHLEQPAAGPGPRVSTAATTGPGAELVTDLRTLAATGREAFNRLVLANVRLVAWLSRRRVAAGGNTLDHDDLFAEGLKGLIHAAHKYDYTLGYKFCTYATVWISNYQQRAEHRARGIPVRIHEQQRAIARARTDLTTELSRTPTAREVSLRVGLSIARISELESYRPARALDGPNSAAAQDTDWSLLTVTADHTTPDPEDALVAAQVRDDVHELLSTLTDRQRRVLTLRFGLDTGQPLTVDQIAARLRVPARLVDATVTSALQELRTVAGNLELHDATI